MPRTILVGDVHGCREELEDLLALVGLTRSDRLVSVGDVVVRGPDPAGAVRLLRSLGARAVRGNHEDRLLRHRARARPPTPKPLSPATRATLEALGDEDFGWLAQLPYWLDLDEHGVRVVHAGVLPGLPIDEQSPRVLMNLRSLTPEGAPVFERGGPPWAARYPAREGDGAPHVVFGHNADPVVQLHPHATGIDTGCVYGGRLTAMVLGAGEPPPPPSQRRDVLVSVPARRAWVPIR